MITNFTTSKEIIAKVFMDMNLQEESHRIVDWKEWISEGLEKIGAVNQLTRKISGVDGEKILEVNNYQVALPTDLYRLEQVAFSFTEDGFYKSARYSASNADIRIQQSKETQRYSTTKAYYTGNTVLYQMDNVEYIFICKKDNNLDGVTPQVPGPDTSEYWGIYIQYSKLLTEDYPKYEVQYFIKPGYAVFSIDHGFVKLTYDAYNLDEDGYPMVPDMASYKEALYWYILMKLNFPRYLNGEINEKQYMLIESKWRFYRQQAYAEALMPGNSDQMTSIKNAWLRLFPEINEDETFYHNLTEQQRIYNRRYGRNY